MKMMRTSFRSDMLLGLQGKSSCLCFHVTFVVEGVLFMNRVKNFCFLPLLRLVRYNISYKVKPVKSLFLLIDVNAICFND